jgi:uncharacterized protein YecT (DUF1311 family)
MRKIISLTVICSLTLSLAACGKSTTDRQNNSSVNVATTGAPEADTTPVSETTEDNSDNNDRDSEETNTEETSAEKTSTEETSNDTFSYSSLKDTLFSFSSGAGGWCTELFISEDGSFKGNYHDWDFVDPDDEDSKGLMYSCEFEGNFGKLEKVDDLTYKTTIKNIEYKNEPDTKEKIDGVSYLYTTAYGLNEAEDIYFYLPGSKVKELPEDFVTWINMAIFDYDTETQKDTLDFVGLYNEKPKYGFSSSNYSNDYNANVNNTKELSDSLRKEIQEEELNQAQLNEKAKDLYELWDNQLNDLWAVLLQTLSEDEMQNLKTDEINWINKKEKKLKKIRKKYKGASMAPMQEYLKAADLTENRVYVLLKYLE